MMNIHEAFYEYVKKVIESQDSASHSEDKVRQITSAIELVEIVNKAPQ